MREICDPLRPITFAGVDIDAPATYPQQNTLVIEEIAQHMPPLHERAVTSEIKVLVRLADTDVNPIPNSPNLFEPQQCTACWVDRRQA
jgi:hypothetical protein